MGCWECERTGVVTVDEDEYEALQAVAKAAKALEQYGLGDPEYDFPCEVQASEVRAIVDALAVLSKLEAEAGGH